MDFANLNLRPALIVLPIVAFYCIYLSIFARLLKGRQQNVAAPPLKNWEAMILRGRADHRRRLERRGTQAQMLRLEITLKDAIRRGEGLEEKVEKLDQTLQRAMDMERWDQWQPHGRVVSEPLEADSTPVPAMNDENDMIDEHWNDDRSCPPYPVETAQEEVRAHHASTNTSDQAPISPSKMQSAPQRHPSWSAWRDTRYRTPSNQGYVAANRHAAAGPAPMNTLTMPLPGPDRKDNTYRSFMRLSGQPYIDSYQAGTIQRQRTNIFEDFMNAGRTRRADCGDNDAAERRETNNRVPVESDPQTVWIEEL